MNHQPLGGVERYGIGPLDALKPYPEFRTNERAARVSRVNVKPHVFLVADDANFLQVVEAAGPSRAQSRADLLQKLGRGGLFRSNCTLLFCLSSA